MEAIGVPTDSVLTQRRITQNNNFVLGISMTEYIVNVFILYFLSGAVLYMFNPDKGSVSKAIDFLWIFIYLVIFILAKENIFNILKDILNNKILLILSGVVLFSPLWSQAPEISLRRSLSYFICIIYGFYISNKFKNEDLVRLFFYLSCLIISTCIVSVVLLPGYAIAKGIHNGAWQGVYFHKNGLGRIAGLCMISISIYYRMNTKLNVLSILMSVLCALLLIMSKSSTSLIALSFTLPAYLFLRWTYKNYNSYKGFFNVLLLLLSIYLIVLFFDAYSASIFNGVGKDDSLSGRVPLWTILLEYISVSPIYGYGYSAFWIPKLLSTGVWLDTGWDPEQGHNGFIDITLELGIVGLVLFLIVLIKGFRRSIQLIKNSNDESHYWYILVLIYLVVVSFTESFILKYNNIYWLMLILCCISVKKIPFLIKNKNNKTLMGIEKI